MNSPTKEINHETPAGGETCGLCDMPTVLDEEGIPYIICQPCYEKFLSVSAVYQKQLDELPFGIIDLDPQATVIAYNRTEADLAQLQADKVVGRNFFTEVAPCTAVQDFQGRFQAFISGAERTLRFYFTFSFKHGPVKVEIFFLRDNLNDAGKHSEQSTRIIVKRVTR